MRVRSGIAFVLLLAVAVTSAFAVPPHPDLVEKWRADGVLDEQLKRLQDAHDAGICSPSEPHWQIHKPERLRSRTAAGTATVDTVWVPVILCEFPDYRHNQNIYAPSGATLINTSVAATPASFDSLLFSRQGDPVSNPTGSMTDFYWENSYQTVLVRGDVLGWYTMPENYTFYEGGNNGLGGTGAILARDAILAADDAGVDFSKYGNDNNLVPAVIVVHAGPGAETGAWGIWSHKFSVSVPSLDGVSFNIYTMNPEEQSNRVSNMGVYAHEFGHTLGLPDLYHLGGGTGQGIGQWSLMAGGSWNGNGARPAHMDAWCKSQSGTRFVDVIWLDTISNPGGLPDGRNLYRAEIPAVETTPVVYALRNQIASSSEYWLVENRQRIGFDDNLPGSGLMIYHVDFAAGTQNNSARYLVDVEQADGLRQLNLAINSGDAADPWPGSSNNRNFTNGSAPNSMTNTGATSQIGVWNISSSGALMYADLDITFSRPDLKLAGPDSISFYDAPPGGDGDDILEPGETIRFDCGIRNFARIAYGTRVTLTCNDPSIYISTEDTVAEFEVTLNPSFTSPIYLESPILITLPDDFQSAPVDFVLTIAADSVSNAGSFPYLTTIPFSAVLGPAQVLLVDDDGGSTLQLENRFAASLNALRVPFDTWSKNDSGVPGALNLQQYKSVIWFTGGEYDPHIGGDLTTEDAAVMKTYLDNGGNLCLTSLRGLQQLGAHSSSFLSTYFKISSAVDSASSGYFRGIDGTSLGEGTRYQVTGGPIDLYHRKLTVAPGGIPFMYLGIPQNLQDRGTCGVFSEGTYKTVALSVGIEFFADGPGGTSVFPKDTLIARILEFFRRGSATDVQDDLNNGLVPQSFTLDQNYPNPFNPTTTISFTVASTNGRPAATSLVIYNMMGQQVRTLVDVSRAVGSYQVEWDGRTNAGTPAASGVYFYRLTVGDRFESRKMMLIK